MNAIVRAQSRYAGARGEILCKRESRIRWIRGGLVSMRFAPLPPIVRALMTHRANESRGEMRIAIVPVWSARRLIAVLLIGAALAAAGCGTKTVTSTGANGQITTQTVKNIHFSNTKFVLHMGLAFGAFHRYIYKPIKTGAFKSGAPGRGKAFLKAAAAAAFIVHELRIAHDDALSSDQLRPLANKLDNLVSRITGLIPGFKGGSAALGDIGSAAGAVSALGGDTSALGVPITDIAHGL
jgi:hypothetical protein